MKSKTLIVGIILAILFSIFVLLQDKASAQGPYPYPYPIGPEAYRCYYYESCTSQAECDPTFTFSLIDDGLLYKHHRVCHVEFQNKAGVWFNADTDFTWAGYQIVGIGSQTTTVRRISSIASPIIRSDFYIQFRNQTFIPIILRKRK